MTTTPNMGLTKDAESGELYSVARVNANSDKIDTYCGENRSRITSLESGKQDALTFDTAPTSMSTNPVTSGGVFSALWSLTDIESGTDLDTLTDLGIYRCRTGTITDTLSHCPIAGGSGFRLVVNRTSHTTKFYQLLMPASVTDANIYLRKYDGSWGSWFRFAGQEVT